MPPHRLEQHQRGVFKDLTYLNVTKPFPYKEATFDFVFSCHLLEHLFIPQAQTFIGEIFRVLKPGGICRIVVLDLDKIVADYDPPPSNCEINKFFADAYIELEGGSGSSILGDVGDFAEAV
jgi:ubiquinone/menaquinone biosynthesis C-methylase UbiE